MDSKRLVVDFDRKQGRIKPLHGVNFGPIYWNGVQDSTKYLKKLRIPRTRLHDCPYAVSGTADIHYVFPLLHEDPHDPKNYVFLITDDYIQSIKDIGSDIVYRLGESIEHHTRNRYFVHPPADFEKWAEVCIQIIRHYNEGWANGFHHDIKHWDIWNEPFGDRNWTGTPEEYYRLYEITAKRIKAHDPSLKVGTGGPEYWIKFCDGLVQHCRDTDTPIDYFIWHSYQHHPKKMLENGRGVRAKLNEYGFTSTELHLNEWSHNPDNDWGYISEPELKAEPLISRIQGAEGAAYAATTLAWLQDFCVDSANFYWARDQLWGFFDHYQRPTRLYTTFEAFVELFDLGDRVLAEGNDEDTGVGVLAAVSEERRTAAVLASNFESGAPDFSLSLQNLPWEGPFEVETLVIDDEHALVPSKKELFSARTMTLHEQIPAPSVRLFRIRAL